VSTPRTSYVKNGDVNLAYQVTGSGSVDIFHAGDWAGHLEGEWDHPAFAGFLHRLGSFARLVRMDRRGQGLSDRRVPPTAIEEDVDDMRVVMDAAYSFRPFLFGAHDGAARAALFAATHPKRVAGLILFAGYAKASISDDFPDGAPQEFLDMLLASTEQTWGGEHGAQSVAPSAGPEERAFMARVGRLALGPGDALQMMRLTTELDIRAVLPAITAPTLVLHHSDDQTVPFSQSRYLAEAIAGARLVELPGDSTVPWIDDGRLLDEIEEFVTGARPTSTSNRALTTVLFTDIVRSTERASELGDAKWRTVISEHDQLMASVLEGFGGRLVKTTGDGIVATFDGPARAIRSALAMGIAAHSLDLELRSGVHTGEVEVLEHDLAGVAVHIAARVASLAHAGQVLVTSTVRDLVVGAGIEFTDEGSHALRGVPDEWHLFAVQSG
jgi:class 3 adenylate cyclase